MAMVAGMLALVQRMALNLYHFLSRPPKLIRKRYVIALILFSWLKNITNNHEDMHQTQKYEN